MKKFSKNIISVYASSGINGVLGIIIIPISVAVMGYDGYGMYTIYLTLLSILSLVDLGIGKNLQRIVASNKSDESIILNTSVACGLYIFLLFALVIASPLIYLLVTIYIFPVESERRFTLNLIMLFVLLEFFFSVIVLLRQNIAVAKEKFTSYAKFSSVSGFLRYVILYFGVLVTEKPEYVVGLMVIKRLFDIPLGYYFFGSMPVGAFKPRWELKLMRNMLGNAFHLSVAQFLQIFTISSGAMLVNNFFGLDSLGRFRAAFDMASKVWIISNGFGLVIFPKLVVSFASKEREKFSRKFVEWQNISFYFYLLLCAIVVVCVVFADVIGVNNEFIDPRTTKLFQLLVFGVCMNAHANMSYEAAQSIARYNIAYIYSGLSIIIIFALFLLLQANKGLLAIGYAWAVSQFIYAVAFDSGVIREIDVRRKIIQAVFVEKVILGLMTFLLVINLSFNFLEWVLILYLILRIVQKRKALL